MANDKGEQFLKKEGRDEKDSESGKKESRLMIENDKEEKEKEGAKRQPKGPCFRFKPISHNHLRT